MTYSARSIIGAFLDFVYPPLCLVCGALLSHGTEHVCDACRSSIALAKDHPALIEEISAKLRSSVDGVQAPFVFQKTGPLQTLVHALKYEKIEAVGMWLGERLGEELVRSGHRPDILIPVPLHKAKERERGYNQSVLIAMGCARAAGGRVLPAAVRRTRNTRTQTKLSIEERKMNVTDVFEVDGSIRDELPGATVLIVDDVITTGATIGACAKVLRATGANRLLAGSAALADHAA